MRTYNVHVDFISEETIYRRPCKGCVKSDRALKMDEEDINKLAGSKLERALR